MRRISVIVLLFSAGVSCDYYEPAPLEQYSDCTPSFNLSLSRTISEPIETLLVPPDSNLIDYAIISRTTQPLMTATRPWESSGINWSSVSKVNGIWKMWYEAYDSAARTDFDGFLCYAESADGIKWNKPELELVEYGGSLKNNIVAKGMHGATVVYDEALPVQSRYQMVFTMPDEQDHSWVFGMTSADGIKFDKLSVLLKANSDTQPSLLADEGKFRLYLRIWDGGKIGFGKRTIGYTETSSLGGTCFAPPFQILHFKTAHDRDLYNSAVAKVSNDLYLMFPSVFYHTADILIPHLGYSKDGVSFRLLEKEQFIPLGSGFDSQAIYCSPSLIKGEKQNQYILYYAGKSRPHSAKLELLKSSYTGGIGRVVFEIF